MAGQSTCDPEPAGDPALLGGEKLVYAFDADQVVGVGYDAAFGDSDPIKKPTLGHATEILRHGDAVRPLGDEGFEMPKNFTDALAGTGSKSVVVTFSVGDSSGQHHLIDGTGTSGSFSIRYTSGKIWIEAKQEGALFAKNFDVTRDICKPIQIAVIYDRDSPGLATTYAYLDGIHIQSPQSPSTPDWAASTNATVGAKRNGDDRWNGRIDEIRVYDRALLPIELDALRNGVYCESGCDDEALPAARVEFSDTQQLILEDGTYVFDAPVDVIVRAADTASGVGSIKTSRDGVSYTDHTTAATSVFSAPAESFTTGPGSLFYNATDEAGNDFEPVEQKLLVDDDPPFASWSTPQPGKIYIGETDTDNTNPAAPALETLLINAPTKIVKVDAADAGSGIKRAAFYLDGSLQAFDTTGPPWQFTLTRPLAPVAVDVGDRAQHTLRVVVIDFANNERVLEQHVIWG